MKNKYSHRSYMGIVVLACAAISALPTPAAEKAKTIVCNRTIKAQVIALDQPWMWNRLGASQPGGMTYALASDVVSEERDENGKPVVASLPADLNTLKSKPEKISALIGHVRLRDSKRPRPLVLRANKGDCLEVTFLNLLTPQPAVDPVPSLTKPPVKVTRWAGIHAAGMDLLDNISADSSWVGNNANSLAKNGEIKTYRWYAAEEGTFLIYSAADMEGGSNSYQAKEGLFGAIHIEPEGAEWYRSQITHDELVLATQHKDDLRSYAKSLQESAVTAYPLSGAQKPRVLRAEHPEWKKKTMVSTVQDKRTSVEVYEDEQGRIHTGDGQPLINYHAVRPAHQPAPGKPVLQMLAVNQLNPPFYNKNLKHESVEDYAFEMRDLDAGAIPPTLREIFKENGRELSLGARATEQNGYHWLITDQGKAYSLVAKPPIKEKKVPGELTIYDAELELIASDLTAVITGPNAGRFPYSNTGPTFRQNPASPDRRQPYREYTIIYHQSFFTAQSFASFRNYNLVDVIQAGSDNFAINYGSAAIGPEVIANRLGVGPMGNADAVDLKFEEFFLSGWAVGDPAMVVDVPANAPNEMVQITPPSDQGKFRTEVPPGSVTDVLVKKLTDEKAKNAALTQNNPPNVDDFAPLAGKKATKAFFPDDPSNVYHSYMNDHVKFRILHAGPGPSHVHHLHAHQWLRSPNSDDSHYLDSQLIIPGTAFTLEIAYGGSGNRNKTVGDSIFHCHFYPHFAQGMWALWRVHDVFEDGTVLKDGVPVAGENRALPDGEIERGTPIPAIVPLPTIGMAPVPAKVKLTNLKGWKDEGQGRRVEVIPELGPEGKPVYKNPGFPFYIPGVAGHRAPHPPLDFAWLEDPDSGKAILTKDGAEKIYLDGGLPRHLVLGGTIEKEYFTRWDFTKDTGLLYAYELPEEGTPVERAAMQTHATRTRTTSLPNGDPGNFILNGLPATHGAPYSDPGVDDQGNSNFHRRRYQAAVFQLDTTLNKKGWHYPQQRILSLWQDVKPTYTNERPPEPFFFRTNTSDSIQFWHTNLVPGYYEVDDFQVRTPTDIIGQHIHLVKFDVTSSDGGANGFNYEDGTLAPDDVQHSIKGINKAGGLFGFDEKTGFVDRSKPKELTVKNVDEYYPAPKDKDGKASTQSIFGPPPKEGAWNGAQTTIQLWKVDSLLDNEGVDRTLRTVFSHDHFGPSTHQQAGLYAGMVVEPENSEWHLPDGTRMNTRLDGGPTSWQGYVVTENPRDSYREFMLEFQDMQLAYELPTKQNPAVTHAYLFDPDTSPNASPAFDLAQAHMPINALNQEIAGSALTYYIGKLNREKLPLTENGNILYPGFPDLFRSFGVPLSEKATVKVVELNKAWDIKEEEADGVTNAGATYKVRAPGVQYIGVKGFEVTAPNVQPLLVYTPDLPQGFAQPTLALNPPTDRLNTWQNKQKLSIGAPFPQLVSQNEKGTYSLNYRNEPLPFRLAGPAGDGTDLALAYSSIVRGDPELDQQPRGQAGPPSDPPVPRFPKEPLVPNAQPTDPFTPLLQAYPNDRVMIRTLVGAHTQAHIFQMHGVKWLYEPDNLNSGWRNAQIMGLSEHFEMRFQVPGTLAHHDKPLNLKDLQGKDTDMKDFADYFFSASSDTVGLNNGLWGIMRAYAKGVAGVAGVHPLPNNPQPSGEDVDLFKKGYEDAVAQKRGHKEFDVVAVADTALPGGKMVFNKRGNLSNANAVLFVRKSDLDQNGKLRADVPVEPLILRAAAGEWIKVTLENKLDNGANIFVNAQNIPKPQTLPAGTPFNDNPLKPVEMFVPKKVGLHPQLVGFDPVKSNGVIVGFNPDVLVPQGGVGTFYWYAGEVKRDENGQTHAKPIEFGATNLTPADQLLQPQFGMVGALIIEPQGSTWVEDVASRASAVVFAPGQKPFREFIVVDQNVVSNSGNGAVNFRSEPFSVRGDLPVAAPEGFSQAYANSILNPPADPETPVFVAPVGTPTRFRLLIPSGTTSNAVTPPPVFIVHGHHWQEEPYVESSTEIGYNPLSETNDATQGGPNQKFDLLFPSAGGFGRVPGDYLYQTYQTAGSTGTWGLFRVTPLELVIAKAAFAQESVTVSGKLQEGTTDGKSALPAKMTLRVSLASDPHSPNAPQDIEVPVSADGQWSFVQKTNLAAPARVQVTAIGDGRWAGATSTATVSDH